MESYGRSFRTSPSSCRPPGSDFGRRLHKVLTEAERDGLIPRHPDVDDIETARLYELTALGRSLGDPERWCLRAP
jgi:hypothetical protein